MVDDDSARELPDVRRPLLIYDGDCAFCMYWVRYWQQLTGDRVTYAPYQQVASQYPAIPVDEFRRAVQYIAPDGEIAGAAEASFLTLSHAPGKSYWLWLYRNIPGFAFITEIAYAFIAARRTLFDHVSRFLWGRHYAPPRYELVSWLFLRLFGMIALSAFVSFAVQAKGLIGSHGILPLTDFVDLLNSRIGIERYFLVPMVFWLNASDLAIQTVCWAGAALSLLLVCNLLPRLSLFLLYVLYLSLLYAGQAFMSYQWDTFLLETAIVALVLGFATLPGIWLLRWLLFRFMFLSGVVKLISGDDSWWNLSALSYHFLTQPLPTPLAWYVAQLPPAALKWATGAVFFVELVLPFLIFCPRRLRFFAGFGIFLLQLGILLTGNYNWFNLQTMLLCLVLFDDAALRRVFPQRLLALLQRRIPIVRPHRIKRYLVGAVSVLLVFCSLVEMDVRFGGRPPDAALAVDEFIGPLHLVSAYGLFAVMTKQRNEIVVEGSNDGVDWREYGFRYKPGDVARAPPWNIPHQPRLDWQMWFAALESPRGLPWFSLFLERILENQPDVMALMETNPFPDAPPAYVRAAFYDYTFSSPAEKAKGIWWRRRLLGLYFPPARLNRPALSEFRF
ncbi:MAG TPA: lipase maturation factor family protein [Rhizomicrobium sp.]|jgi:predicted DCC family thiol-disulfide oxidoreductase YuxK